MSLVLASAVAYATSFTVTLTDTVDLQDFAATNGRRAADTVPLQDSAKNNNEPATDVVSVTDSPLAGQSARDTLALGDDTSPSSTSTDLLQLSDSPSVATTVFHPVSATDTISILDEPLPDLAGRDAVALSDSPSIEATEFHALAATDTVPVSDRPFANFAALDALLLSESASVASFVFQAVSAIDSLALSDAPSLFEAAADALQLDDAVLLPNVAATTVVDMLDTVAKASVQNISDTVGVVVEITDIAAQWFRFFYEPFTIFDCTQFACNYVLHLNEGVELEQGFELMPVAVDTISVGDSISRTLVSSRGLDSTVSASERADFMFAPVPPDTPSGIPPLGVTFGTSTAVAEPVPAEPVSGTFTMPAGDPGALAAQLDLPSIDISSAVMPGTTLLLPSYLVSLASTVEFPADEVMMTPVIMEVPADLPVLFSLDMAGTPSASEHAQVQWMELGFTPAVSSTDFALIVSPLDGVPVSAPEPRADVAALYMDFGWVGGFAGADPADTSFYSDPPSFTFALSDQWAEVNRIERDDNGVPVISLNLLDESTGEWVAISDVDAPAGATDGEYVYVAHLEHFSTYVVMADRQPSVSAAPDAQAILISESLGISESAAGRDVGVIEEFAGERFAANLLDSVTVSSRPVAYKALTVGEDVEVLVAVQDVVQGSALPPSAAAVFEIAASNAGSSDESFILKFWYVDANGARVESSQEITLGPHESALYTAEIPFGSPGTFDVSVEALSIPEGTVLSATQLAVDVPWLAVYIYLLLTLAVVIIAGSAMALALYLKRRASGPALLVSGKAPTRAFDVSVTEGEASGAGPGLYVGVKVANAEAGVLHGTHVAQVDFDLLNKTDGLQEFDLLYEAREKTGALVLRSMQRVSLAAGRHESRLVDLDFGGPGRYVIYVDVRDMHGNVMGTLQLDVTSH